ncbi:hypothetical protein ACHAXT_012564 [Thalassiosira profunda]
MSTATTGAARRTAMKGCARALKRLTPRLHPVQRSRLGDEMERVITGAPAAAFAIPQAVHGDAFCLNKKDGTSSNPYAHRDDPLTYENPGAVVRTMGTSRRVFLLNTALTPTEIDGLAYRIRTMASGSGISSVVLGNPLEDAECNGDMSENRTCLPSSCEEEVYGSLIRKRGPYGSKFGGDVESILHERFGDGLGMPYVSSAYDARHIYEAGMHREEDRLERELLRPLFDLSQAVRGSYDVTIDSSPSKVPLVSFPHGMVTDAGYAFLMGSYVLATHSTAFRMVNPARGLSFDPIGLSYLLPRVGFEFNQPSAEHSWAIACMLALGGYEANAEDMVATGLATHYVGGPFKLNLLERALGDLDTCSGGRTSRFTTATWSFYNVPVANAIQHLSEYDAAGADEYGVYLKEELYDEQGMYLRDKDPSLTMPEERLQMYGESVSELVDLARTFEDVFEEDTVEGMVERLKEVAATKAEFEDREGYEEDVGVAEAAQRMVDNMERRSPLALKATHLQLAVARDDEDETLESCMEREAHVQTQLFAKEDFARWAESGKGVGLVEMTHGSASLVKEREDSFTGWTHSSLTEVTMDEAMDIVGVEVSS